MNVRISVPAAGLRWARLDAELAAEQAEAEAQKHANWAWLAKVFREADAADANDEGRPCDCGCCDE